MSLEKAIEENTAVLRELIAVMADGAKRLQPSVGGDHLAALEQNRAHEQPAPADKPPAARREKRQTEGEAAALKLAGTAGDPAKFDYETVVKPKLQQLQAEVSKEALIAVLHRHGAKSVKELTQGMYPTVMAMAQESIDKKNAAAEEADLSGDDDLV